MYRRLMEYHQVFADAVECGVPFSEARVMAMELERVGLMCEVEAMLNEEY